MIKQHMMLALVGTALMVGPALAQSTNPPASSAPAASASAGGGQFISQAQSGQWRASKLVGVDIYGSNNEKIGDVNEVLLDKGGQPQAVIIGVGGFLGVGAKDVALPWSAVQWKDTPAPSTASRAPAGSTSTTGAGGGGGMTGSTSASTTPKVLDYPDHGVISMTKDQLQNAPAFKYASDTSSSDTSRPASPSAPAGSTR